VHAPTPGAPRRGRRSRARRAPDTRVVRRRRSSLRLLEVVLERPAHLRAGAVEEYSLIGLRNLQRVTDLFGRPALDVAQADHGALRRRQLPDRALDHGAGLAGEQALLRRPRLRVRAPVARPARVVRAAEAVRVDGGLWHAGGVAERRKRKGPSLALRTRLRDVREDPEDP